MPGLVQGIQKQEPSVFAALDCRHKAGNDVERNRLFPFPAHRPLRQRTAFMSVASMRSTAVISRAEAS